MPRVQLQGAGPSNVLSFFVVLLSVSQVHASCEAWDTSCSPSFPTQSIIGLVVGGIVLGVIGVVIRTIRRRRFRQRSALPAYSTAGAYTGWGMPNNGYGRPQSNIFRPPLAQTQRSPGQSTQMNSWSQHTAAPLPPFPKPSYSSLRTPARTQPPSMPSPTRRPRPHQTPYASPSSPDSPRLSGMPPQPLHAFSLRHSLHSSPPDLARVSADLSPIAIPPAINTTIASPPPSHIATSVARPSPPENMEMHPLRVQTEVVNEEPPPAYTPI